MTILTKVLIGATAIGAGVAIVECLTSNEEVEAKKEEKVVDITEEIVKREDDTVLKKIKRFVKKKFIKFLAWVTLHMEQIEAVGAVVGLAGSVISISGAVRDFARGNDLNDKIDRLEQLLYKHDRLERDRVNHLGVYIQENVAVINENLKTTDKDVIALAEKLGHPLLAPNEVFE